MLAVIRKAVKAILHQRQPVVKNSSDEMLEALRSTEHDLRNAVHNKQKEVDDLHSFCEGFLNRVKEIEKIIWKTDDVKAIEELQTLRASAQKLANAYGEAYDQEKPSLESLRETLIGVVRAKKNLISLKERAELDATLQAFVNNPLVPQIDSTPEFDKSEIALVVHTANALVELRTGSR